MVSDPGYLRPFLDGTHFLYGVGDNPRTLSELGMNRLSAELRSIPDWWTLSQDPHTRHLWSEDAISRHWQVGPPNSFEVQLTRKQVEYVLHELYGYASLRDDHTGIQVSCFDRIWESQSLITPAIHATLRSALGQIRRIDRRSPSPSSFRRTLVDIHRYCLVYDRTWIKPPNSKHTIDTSDYTLSTSFAALPTDISISADGHAAKCISYINNIDPIMTDIYTTFEDVLAAFIGLFERVLTDLHRNNPLTQRIQGTCRYVEWDEPESPEDSDDEEAWDDFSSEFREWELNRPIQMPDIPEGGYNGDLPRRNHQVSLAGRQIQVLFSVTEFHLTPNKPICPESDWRVEGMKNERIVACAFHVCNIENINADLSFRMAVTSPRGFIAGDRGGTLRTWGMVDGDPCNQILGSVRLRSGLAIAFPNIYQHRFGAMSLENTSTGGRMTLLAMYLVDPDAPPVISTADVPPQQREWVYRALVASLDQRLPIELVERIVGEVETLMGDEDADVYEQEMRDEWERFRIQNDAKYFSLPFDIWSGVQHR